MKAAQRDAWKEGYEAGYKQCLEDRGFSSNELGYIKGAILCYIFKASITEDNPEWKDLHDIIDKLSKNKQH